MQDDDSTLDLPQTAFQPGRTIAKRYHFAALESPLRRLGYVLPASDSIVRLSPDGRELERFRFGFSQLVDDAIRDHVEAYLFDANSDQSILLASFPVSQRTACGGIQKLFDAFLYATNEGAYISNFGGEVWQGSADGQKRRLWPAP